MAGHPPRSERHQLADILRNAEIDYEIEPFQDGREQLKPVATDVCAFCQGESHCLPSYTLTVVKDDYRPRFTFDRHDRLIGVDVTS